MNKATASKIALLASALAISTISARATQTLVFTGNIDTSFLSAEAADAPFDLDFQLNWSGASNASSSVTLSNFVFTGGAATGSAYLSGLATGSLSSSVALTANSANEQNEFYQGFTSGVTDISFKATVTEPGPDIGSPAEFAATIFDNSLGFPAPIYSTAPDAQSLIILDLNSANTVADVQSYSPVSSADGLTPLSSVPDPAPTAALLGGAVLALGCFARRFGFARSQALDTGISA